MAGPGSGLSIITYLVEVPLKGANGVPALMAGGAGHPTRGSLDLRRCCDTTTSELNDAIFVERKVQ